MKLSYWFQPVLIAMRLLSQVVAGRSFFKSVHCKVGPELCCERTWLSDCVDVGAVSSSDRLG